MSPLGPSVAQASRVTFALNTLGWKAFQTLCSTIAAEIWGQTVQGFADTHDGGRDGAFYGEWHRRANELYRGTFAVQCKFTSKPDSSLRRSDVEEEIAKAARLASRGLAENYFLMTNAHVSGTIDEELRGAFESIPGVERFASFGYDWICRVIVESARLRMLVPRVYGLGDLTQIMDERAYSQAREILSALGDDLAKFVITDAYRRAAGALVEHGFVLLLGEPACGKSTIAAALAVGAIDEWGCSTLKVRDADEFVAHSNPNEPKQFFWVDDAFGATQYDWSSAPAWNGVLPHLQAAIRRGARVLFTSRDYVYEAARRDLKESAFPKLNESQVVIRVEELSSEEREQILYNHIRLGAQPAGFKTRVKPLLTGVAAHPGFGPEIARRLGNPLFTKSLSLTEADLESFVARPVELLREVVRTLDRESRCALGLVFVSGGSLRSPVMMSEDELRRIEQLGGSPAGVRSALKALRGSLLLLVLKDGIPHWRFKHPTISDAFADLVADDPELLDVYLSGTPLDRLLTEVSCGEVGVKGVRVVIPRDRYRLLVARLQTMGQRDYWEKRRLHWFLAHRCEREFIADFIEGALSFVDGLVVGSYLYAVSDVGVLTKLNELGLLPEPKRVEVISGIAELATTTPDAGFLREQFAPLFVAGEVDAILNAVRENLLPRLSGVVAEWRLNFTPDGGEEPAEYFSELRDALESYRTALSGDLAAVQSIDTALERIKQAVEDLRPIPQAEQDYEDPFDGESGPEEVEHARSVFDDVDA